MESIHKLENTIEGWLKPLPHLPTNWRVWIAKNVWWIVLVGVILSVLGTLMLVAGIMTAMAAVGTVNSVYGAYGVNIVQDYSGWWYIASIVSMVFLVATIVLEAMAITPLKAQNKKGWDLLFIVFLIGVASSVISAVLNIGSYSVIANVIGSIIGIVIGAYFLFEIRSYFKSAVIVKK
jgi:hypothetical protein